jgi:tetratricopeptide (TPR) repeat protein
MELDRAVSTQHGPTRRALAAATLAMLASLGIAGCRTARPEETATGAWHEIAGPRFVLWTDGSVDHARKLVSDLERFHEVMLVMTSARDRPGAPPLRIFMGASSGSLSAWLGEPSGDWRVVRAGTMRATRRGNYAIIDGSQESSTGSTEVGAREILFHEYTHHVSALQGGIVPNWYNEGLAEYMSTTQFRDDGSYTFGCPAVFRTAFRRYMRWLPMQQVLEAETISSLMAGASGFVRTRTDPTDSYAQSWYALHYINDDSQRQKQLSQYLRDWASGKRSEQDFTRAFGMGYSKFDHAVEMYSLRSALRCAEIQPRAAAAAPRVRVRPMSRDEAKLHIGDLLVALGRPGDAAFKLLQEAAAADPDDLQPLIALARAHLDRAEADAKHSEIELDKADAFLRQAERLKPSDPELLTVRGYVDTSRARQLHSKGEDPTKTLANARSSFRKAIRSNELLAEAYAGLGLTYLLSDNGSIEGPDVLDTAVFMLPLDGTLAVSLGQLYVQRGEAKLAVPVLERALNYIEYAAQRKAATELLAKARAAIAQNQAMSSR